MNNAVTPADQELREANQALLIASIHQHELTEQAEAAEAIAREGESLLRLAQEAAHAGVWTWEASSDRLTWSPDTCDLFGIDSNSPVSYESWRKTVHPTDRDRADAASRRAMAPGGSGDLNIEYRIYHPQRGLRWLQSIGRKIDLVGRPGFMTGITLDITERKQADAAVRRSEESLRDFLDNSPIGIHWVGADGNVLWANQAELDLLGYSRQEFIGRSIAQFHADQPVIEEMMARLASGETLRQFEARLVCKDGSIRHVLVNSNALFEDGKIVRTRCFTQDITLRRQAEEALRQSEQNLAAALDALPAAVYTTDADGRITHYNQAAVELSGRVPQLGTEQWCVTWKLFRADGTPLPHDQCPMAVALKTGRPVPRTEIIAERPDGTRAWVAAHPTPLLDSSGRVARGINMLLDITETKQAELANARLAAIVESSDDAIISKSLDGVITSWNEGAERIFGYSQSEAIGQSVTMLIPTERLDEEPSILERIRRGERIDHYETVRRRKDGSLLGISLTVSPIFDSRGQIVGASKIARDITERRRADEALRDADRRKDEFLATLAHELRNPLAAISNAVQLSRTSQAVPEDQAWAQEMLDRQLELLGRLVDDLLDVARIRRGQIDLKRELVSLPEVLHRAVATVQPQIDRAHHRLTVKISPDPAWVEGDRARLQQVLVNLLGNAAKYTPDGGQIAIQIRPDGGDAVLSVRDTGIGIARDTLPTVFELFSQDAAGRSRSQGGLGIGLSLVRRLVELHGGHISAESAGPGQGSTFTVRLPLAQPPAAKEAPRPQAAPRANGAQTSQARILVVDDNQDAAQTLGRLLKLKGFQTEVAFDGVQALEAAERLRPEFALLDIGLPGLDGYELAGRLKQTFPGICAVAISGYGQAADRQRAKESGFDEHFTKPVKLDSLLELITSRLTSERG